MRQHQSSGPLHNSSVNRLKLNARRRGPAKLRSCSPRQLTVIGSVCGGEVWGLSTGAEQHPAESRTRLVADHAALESRNALVVREY